MSLFARYFFHLVSDDEVIPDEEGIDLWNDDGTLLHIIKAVNDLLREGLPLDDWQGWRLEVMDGTGRLVVCIPLADLEGWHSRLP